MTLHNIPENKVFNNWKKEFSKENRILSIKNLFKISRNNKYIARGIDVQFKYNNKKITRYLLLLGKSVQIIPLIFCTTDKKYYSILVEQIRIGAKKKILEFPSGSVDTKDKSLKEACIREIDEELNIKVKKNQLLQLSKYPVIMQPVNSYLKCFFFTFEIKLNKVKMLKLHNKKTGVSSDDEYCLSKVLRLKKIDKLMNDSSLLGMALLIKKKKIQKKQY